MAKLLNLETLVSNMNSICSHGKEECGKENIGKGNFQAYI